MRQSYKSFTSLHQTCIPLWTGWLPSCTLSTAFWRVFSVTPVNLRQQTSSFFSEIRIKMIFNKILRFICLLLKKKQLHTPYKRRKKNPNPQQPKNPKPQAQNNSSKPNQTKHEFCPLLLNNFLHCFCVHHPQARTRWFYEIYLVSILLPVPVAAEKKSAKGPASIFRQRSPTLEHNSFIFQ